MPRLAARVLRVTLTALLTTLVLAPAATGGRRTVSFESWPFAYHHDCERLEALASSERWIRPDGPTAGMHARILRVLRDLVRQSEDQNQLIEANAIRALAKASNDPADVDLLVRMLDRGSPARQFVQEGAALGLGLLRRTDPAYQLDAADLGAVRESLYAFVVSREDAPARARGMAALSLGLLADQPRVQPAAWFQTSLFQSLKSRYRSRDIGIGILMALAAFPKNRLRKTDREELELGVSEGRLFKSLLRSIPRAYAIRLFGHLDGPVPRQTLRAILTQRRGVGTPCRRAAVLAAGDLALGAPDPDRAHLEAMLLHARETSRDFTIRNYATRSLGRLLEAEIGARETTAAPPSPLAADLLHVAARGKYAERPHALLALGRSLRTWRKVGAPMAYASFERQASAVLRKAILAPDAWEASAAALALGIAGDASDRPRLVALAQQKTLDADGRGYAALGLAFLGPAPETETLIQDRLLQVTDPGERLLLTRALGIAARGDDLKTLAVLKALLQTRGCWQGEAAMALARIGSIGAAQVLLDVAAGRGMGDSGILDTTTRAAAIGGLGRIADPERVPSLSRLTDGIDYRAATDLVGALLSTL